MYNQDEPCLLISHRKLYSHPPPFGMTSRCHILINSCEYYVVHILMREVERGEVNHSTALETVHRLCKLYILLLQALPNSVLDLIDLNNIVIKRCTQNCH